jgi:general stress protein 26
MSSNLDPYTAAAQNDNVTPQEKISGLHNILKSAKIGMLTTRSPDGCFHSRAMTPTSRTSFPYAPLHILTRPQLVHSETQLTLVFLANNASHKFEEIEHDANVNVSFLDQDSTAWAS